MFRCVELTEEQKRDVYGETPDLAEREAVIGGVSARDARQLCTELRSRYDEVAAGIARVLDGELRRYVVRVGSAEDATAANPELGA